MKRAAIVVMLLTVPSFAVLAEVISSPQPPPFAECENEYPDSIVGTWRSDPVWTREELVRSDPDAVTSTTNTVVDGSNATSHNISFTENTYSTTLRGLGQLTREYLVVGGNARHYLLELRDVHGATHNLPIELVPCGIVIETNTKCEETFCLNALDDMFKLIAEQHSGDDVDPAMVAAIREQALESMAEQPDLRVRNYYRRIAEE